MGRAHEASKKVENLVKTKRYPADVFTSLAHFPSKYQYHYQDCVRQRINPMVIKPVWQSGIVIEKLLMSMSYTVLKTQSRTFDKATITVAWVKQVISSSSSLPPFVPPPISFPGKKTQEMGLVFKRRDKNVGVPSSEETARKFWC